MTTIDAPPVPDVPARSSAHSIGRLSAGALRVFFFLSARVPWLPRMIGPLAVRIAVRLSPTVLPNTAANAARIFASPLSKSRQRQFARRVLANFYGTVVDIAGHARQSSVQRLLDRIEAVYGLPEYEATRRAETGAVLVTAHMGSFEIGLAALRRHEPSVHVVFKRDSFAQFESIRARIHQLLDIDEAPIDDGLVSMMKLRDALMADEVVVMQGDRALPGQRAAVLPFLGGHLRLPLGPLRLAELTAAPVIPVFVTRSAGGRCSIHLLPAIFVAGHFDHALRTLGNAIAQFIEAHPDQWLVLHRAFVEDEAFT